MRAIALFAVCLSGLAAAGCAPEAKLDHYWGPEQCTFTATGAASTEVSGLKSCSAYLRRTDSSSALVLHFDSILGSGIGIGNAYPSAAVLQIAIDPGEPGHRSIPVVVGAAIVPSPDAIPAGEAYVVYTARSDSGKDGVFWALGSGQLAVGSVAIADDDQDDREKVTMDADVTLDDVTVTLAGSPTATTTKLGGTLKIHVADAN